MKNQNIQTAFKNKTILVTGHTGFIGTWMSLWLDFLGAKVVGYSLSPVKASMFETVKLNKNITHIIGDVTDFKKLKQIIKINKPEFVFHLAAQAIVRESYDNPLTTFQTNSSLQSLEHGDISLLPINQCKLLREQVRYSEEI